MGESREDLESEALGIPDILEVQVVPSDEVRMVPESPTAKKPPFP